MGVHRYGISLPVFNLMCSLVRYKVKHEKRNSISTSSRVLFCLLHKHTNDDFLKDFPKIAEDSSKIVQRPDKRFRTFFKNFRILYFWIM